MTEGIQGSLFGDDDPRAKDIPRTVGDARDYIRSVGQAREYVRERRGKGVECPVCGAWCKEYERKLNSQMAHFLVMLVAACPDRDKWISGRDLGQAGHKASTDGSYLVHWGLLERHEQHSGQFRPTRTGIQFVHEGLRVASHAFIYHNTLMSWGLDSVDVHEALGAEFDLAEVLADTTGKPRRALGDA
jgi:hypothetical protein